VTDQQLLRFVSSFRNGILGDRKSSSMMCFMVCAPLATLLELDGIRCRLHESPHLDRPDGIVNHFWIRLADGRVLDPTADQFAELRLPKVYLGPPIPEIHREGETR
jgi:hypothetical protein